MICRGDVSLLAAGVGGSVMRVGGGGVVFFLVIFFS